MEQATNNIISVSGGNDSLAMLLVISRIRKQDPEYFAGQTWHAVFFDTGWARDTWHKRIELTQKICDGMNIKLHILQASVINEHITNETNELFKEMSPEKQVGMVATIKKKAIFPNIELKYCTFELKIKPMRKWLKANKFTPKNTVQWMGIRREEGGRLGGTAGGNDQDRAFTTSIGERDGFDVVYPLAYMTTIQEHKLLRANNIEVYHTRSEECYPCIFQMSVRQIADLDESRVDLINNLEIKITNFRKAKYDLVGKDYDKDKIFGMFNFKKLGDQKGIKKQVEWAKERVKFLDNQPKQDGLFADEIVIDDKCKSGYCGL